MARETYEVVAYSEFNPRAQRWLGYVKWTGAPLAAARRVAGLVKRQAMPGTVFHYPRVTIIARHGRIVHDWRHDPAARHVRHVYRDVAKREVSR